MMHKINQHSSWIGISLILAVGIIHLSMVMEEYEEAPYLGIMFVGAGIGSTIAALGIYKQQAGWGWGAGVLIALGSVLGYVISRTIGLPLSGIEPWGPVIGYVSLVLEIIFVVLSAKMVGLRPLPTMRRPVIRATQPQGAATIKARTSRAR
jgi:hypothetical protein